MYGGVSAAVSWSVVIIQKSGVGESQNGRDAEDLSEHCCLIVENILKKKSYVSYLYCCNVSGGDLFLVQLCKQYVI